MLVVDLIMVFLGAMLKQLPAHSTSVYSMLGLVSCVVASVVHIIFDRIIFSWKFDEDYIKRVERRRRRSTIEAEMLQSNSIWGDDGMRGEGGNDYGGLSKGALDVLDNVRFDRKELSRPPRPQGRSVQIDSRFVDVPHRTSGSHYSYSDDVDDHDLNINEDLAFVGLYRPDELESPPQQNAKRQAARAPQLPQRAQRPRLVVTAPDARLEDDAEVGSVSDDQSPTARLKTPPEHDLYRDDDQESRDDGDDYGEGIFGKNDFVDNDEDDDEANDDPNQGGRRRSEGLDEDAEVAQFENSYRGGHRRRQSRDLADIREAKRAAARPVKVVEELPSSSSSDDVNAGEMDDEDNAMFLYGQLAMDIELPTREHRAKPETPAKTVSSEHQDSTLGNDEEFEDDLLSKARPVSQPAAPPPVSILSKYSKYAEATGGDDIDPFDTAAKELGDRPRVWTPIIAFNIRATSISVVCIGLLILGQWRILNSLDGVSSETCDAYPAFLYLTLATHCFVFEPIVVALTYLHRVLNSDEYDDFFSELHPYTGDLRDSGPAS